MTEKEKMMQQQFYFPGDPDLVAERFRAQALCQQINQLFPSDTSGQVALLKKLFGKIGEDVGIFAPIYCDYGYQIEVGDRFFANYQTVFLDAARIQFGDDVMIGPQCGFYTAVHPVHPDERSTFLEKALPIKVGNQVWFGGGVKVMPGVTIGDRVVVAGGSVVTKDVPSDTIVGGNPARVIRQVTDWSEHRVLGDLNE